MSETLYQFCERVVVAGHIRNHAALNRDNFSECRDGFCRDWHETHSNTRAAHPAVEVLEEVEKELRQADWGTVRAEYLLKRIAALRAEKGV